MEAESSFIAQPALVDVDVSAANRPVDCAIVCRLARYASAHGASGVVNSEIAPGAAATAYGAGSLEKPRPHLESKVGAGEGSDRADVDDVAGIRIVEGLVAVNGNFRIMSPIQNDDL